jgi:hypothetical protein
VAQGRSIGIRWITSDNTATRSDSRLDDIERCKWWMTPNGTTADIISGRPFRIQLQSTVLRSARCSRQQQHKKILGKRVNLRLRFRRSERAIFNSSAAVCACRSENACTWYGQVQPHTTTSLHVASHVLRLLGFLRNFHPS